MFPLPLSPFERMMLVEGRPASPMTQVVTLTFSGRADREALDAAVRAAVLRHPLLRARIDAPRSRRPRWVLHDEFPRMHWESNDAPPAAPGGHIDLASGPGLRLRARQEREELRISAELHHACSDGSGLFQFVEDLLGVYAALAGCDEPARALRPLQPGDLAHRARTATGNAGPPLGLGGTLARVREALKFVTERPALLANASLPDRPEPRAQPRLLRRRLSGERTAGLRGVAARGRATINDLLLRELFLTLDRRNGSRGGGGDERWRILVPCDLRERRHEATPAANFTGYGFPTRGAGRCGNPDELLESIRAETTVIRASGGPRHFLDALSLADRVPWVFPLVSSWRSRRGHPSRCSWGCWGFSSAVPRTCRSIPTIRRRARNGCCTTLSPAHWCWRRRRACGFRTPEFQASTCARASGQSTGSQPRRRPAARRPAIWPTCSTPRGRPVTRRAC